MVRNSSLFILLFFCFITNCFSQKYFVFFKDKKGSPYSISKPEEFLSQKAISRRTSQNIPVNSRDLPVTPAYIQELQAQGAEIIYTSRWFNAALVNADEPTFEKIKSLSFVRSDKEYSSFRKTNKSEQKGTKSYNVGEENYGASLIQNQMIGIDEMHREGVYGEGMTIAVLDAGFYKTDEFSVFDSLNKRGRIVSTYDFVNNESSVFEDNAHGMQVLSVMAAYSDGNIIGGAYKSNFILLKTEDTRSETKLEEIYWALGAEYADSAGADILTSSLGYTTFDIPTDNYSISDLDGNTSLVTQAADFAAATGMLVVVSAGNEGNDPWRRLSFPADADSALSVGAVNKTGEFAHFSSVGNTVDKRIKPDVVGMGVGTVVVGSKGEITTNNGTSFSTPLITSLAAGLWQTFPKLSNMEIIDLIKRSGNRNTSPDSVYGWGIPNYTRAKLMQINNVDEEVESDPVIYPNPSSGFITIEDPHLHSDKPYEIVIFNSSYQTVYTKEIKAINNKIAVDDKDFLAIPPGAYFVRIFSSDRKFSRRLIKI